MSSGAGLPAQGSCAGYEIRSSVHFHTLRAGGGTALYVDEQPGLNPVGEVVARWLPRPGNPFYGRLLKDGASYAFWASDSGWYLIDPAAPSITVGEAEDPLTREIRLFGVPAALLALESGDLTVHAAAVEVGSEAILLAGPSRYGKTTLAAAFAGAGHRVLTEDMTRCVVDGEPRVFPGPAVIRLRRDVADRMQVPGTAVSRADQDRVHLTFDEAHRGDSRSVRLRAILMLRQVTEAAELQFVSSVDAVRDLWALTFRLPTDPSRAASFERAADLAARVETLDLRRSMNLDGLPQLVKLVERHVASG
jgi:hypothetical protein